MANKREKRFSTEMEDMAGWWDDKRVNDDENGGMVTANAGGPGL
jgi:hypothetical protein